MQSKRRDIRSGVTREELQIFNPYDAEKTKKKKKRKNKAKGRRSVVGQEEDKNRNSEV